MTETYPYRCRRFSQEQLYLQATQLIKSRTMELDLDVVIDSPTYSVEMKSGLKTLQGASDALTTISETILTGYIPEKKTYKSSVRTRLKDSFEGSFGQAFSLEIADRYLEDKYKQIGWQVFSELISYFLNDSVYKETEKLSHKAQEIVRELGDRSEKLSAQLRRSAMKNLHDTSIKFDYDVKLRLRKNRDEQSVLAKFDRGTGRTLEAKRSRDAVEVRAGVTRFNINTGNGRLQVFGEDQTTAFGFDTKYKLVNFETKKLFSENLDENNGKDPEKMIYLNFTANPIKLRDGKIVKYIISGVI